MLKPCLSTSIMMVCCAVSASAGTVRLEELDIAGIRQGWGTATSKKTVINRPLTLAGTVYENGLGTHAPGAIRLSLDGRSRRFRALVGVDDETGGKGSVRFKAYADERLVYDSGLIKGGQPPEEMDLNLAGVRSLVLVMSSGPDGMNYDHADWADAVFLYSGEPPKIVKIPPEEKVILTPPPPDSPRINGPTVYGVRPGRPFLYRIPCTGRRPIRFAVEGLPDGLTLNAETGIIRGTIEAPSPKTYQTYLEAENPHGKARREFKILVSDTIALTPPMGWNSWYIHYHSVTGKDMREAAHAMIDSGMADYGYQYINIDDGWMKKRGDEPYRSASGAALPNANFPDMEGMVREIHGLGLKAGLYTSPGPWTCGGYVGAWQHEAAEVDQYVKWGIDFVKYDWCSYGGVATGKGIERFQKPYRLMGNLLAKAPRDIVFNLCQYGMGDVWTWGREVGGNSARTTGDLGVQSWTDLPGFYSIGLQNAEHAAYAGPGYWNDPDYILIGWIGVGYGTEKKRPTSLTGNEQYAYMSMWCLMAAPLIFSGDMRKLDLFTLNILCNNEVIDVDQDPRGKQARIVRRDADSLVMAKPMVDGSLAVGLFNLAEFDRPVSVSWKELGIRGPFRVRDIWRQKELGTAEDTYSENIGWHGAKLIRMWKTTR